MTGCQNDAPDSVEKDDDIVNLEAYVDLGRQIRMLEKELSDLEDKFKDESLMNQSLLEKNEQLEERVNHLSEELTLLYNPYGYEEDLAILAYEVNDLKSIVVQLEADFDLAIDEGILEIEQEVYNVGTAKELLEAIGSNRKIILQEGSYNLSQVDYTSIDNPYLSAIEVFDGHEFVLKHVRNLDIVGSGNRDTTIMVEPRYAFIFTFENSRDIGFENMIIGHTLEKGSCVGGVLQFTDCQDVVIENSLLYGCGTYGLVMNGMKRLQFNNSVIEECSYGIMQIYNSSQIQFNNSIFRDNREFDMITLSLSRDISFEKCSFTNNYSDYTEFIGAYSVQDLSFIECTFEDNEAPAFITAGFEFKMVDTHFLGEQFKVMDLIYHD